MSKFHDVISSIPCVSIFQRENIFYIYLYQSSIMTDFTFSLLLADWYLFVKYNQYSLCFTFAMNFIMENSNYKLTIDTLILHTD